LTTSSASSVQSPVTTRARHDQVRGRDSAEPRVIRQGHRSAAGPAEIYGLHVASPGRPGRRREHALRWSAVTE
jgi:hypothetical protein